jgi:hypothetical protein
MHLVRGMIFVAVLLGTLISAESAHGAHPQYLILRQSAGGFAHPTVGHPCAYGWFGVAPRRHTITHTGYYGSHWLWPGQLPQR